MLKSLQEYIDRSVRAGIVNSIQDAEEKALRLLSEDLEQEELLLLVAEGKAAIRNGETESADVVLPRIRKTLSI